MEAVVFIFSLLDCCALIFLSVYFVPPESANCSHFLPIFTLSTRGLFFFFPGRQFYTDVIEVPPQGSSGALTISMMPTFSGMLTIWFLRMVFILKIITLSDLECDYINARSCCSKLNKWVIPELIGHTIVTVLMLVSLHWFIFLLNLPVATWNIYRFIMVPSGNMGVFDPTEIHNRGQLKSHMKEAMIKLGFHLLCFFMYLYSMILALIND